MGTPRAGAGFTTAEFSFLNGGNIFPTGLPWSHLIMAERRLRRSVMLHEHASADGLAFCRVAYGQCSCHFGHLSWSVYKRVGTHPEPELPSAAHTSQKGVGPEPICGCVTRTEGEGHVGAVAAAIVGEDLLSDGTMS